MSDKKKIKNNTASVLSQNKATNMKFVDFQQIGLDAVELGATHAKKNMRVIKKKRRKTNENR